MGFSIDSCSMLTKKQVTAEFLLDICVTIEIMLMKITKNGGQFKPECQIWTSYIFQILKSVCKQSNVLVAQK